MLRSGQTPPPTPAPVTTAHDYTVKSGDTLTGIARRFSVTLAQIQCANSLKNPNSLLVGTVLTIPGSDYQCPRKGGKTPKPSSSAAPIGAPPSQPAA